jgi:hypothetical protein
MIVKPNRFLRSWVLTFIVFVVVAAIFNAVVDPYILLNMPRIAGFNARKPAVDTEQRLMKAYDVMRARPKTVILGSSRAALGMDANDPAWPKEVDPVYNLAFGEGSPYMAYRYLQHVVSRQRVSTVIFGLEFEYFLIKLRPEDQEFESRLAVRRDGSQNHNERQYLRDLLRNEFGLDSLTDSLTTLAANFQGKSSDLRMGNWYWSDLSDRLAGWGTYAQVAMSDVLEAPQYYGRRADPATMEDVTALLDLCKSHGTRVVIFISPAHSDQLEILHLAGQWPAFEQWIRDLVTLVAKYPDAVGVSAVSLWDFTAYDSYTTESVSRDGHALRWFMEPNHYSRQLGNVIIKRISGDNDVHFGVLLTSGNVGSHIEEIRRQRSEYHEQHQADARRVRDLYRLALGIPADSKLGRSCGSKCSDETGRYRVAEER